MEFQKLIEERRTIRKYRPEGKITKDDLITVIKAAQEAPSWKNSETGGLRTCIKNQRKKECWPQLL